MLTKKEMTKLTSIYTTSLQICIFVILCVYLLFVYPIFFLEWWGQLLLALIVTGLFSCSIVAGIGGIIVSVIFVVYTKSRFTDSEVKMLKDY